MVDRVVCLQQAISAAAHILIRGKTRIIVVTFFIDHITAAKDIFLIALIDVDPAIILVLVFFLAHGAGLRIKGHRKDSFWPVPPLVKTVMQTCFAAARVHLFRPGLPG